MESGHLILFPPQFPQATGYVAQSLIDSSFKHTDVHAFERHYGVTPGNLVGFFMHHLTTELVHQKVAQHDKNGYIHVCKQLLRQHVPLRRWVEIFAGPQTRDMYPPVVSTVVELARVFAWSVNYMIRNKIQTAGQKNENDMSVEDNNDDDDWNPATFTSYMLKQLCDLSECPLVEEYQQWSDDNLIRELRHANARKGATLRHLIKYKDTPNVTQRLWLREKDRAAWWAKYAINPVRLQLLQTWLTLGAPLNETEKTPPSPSGLVGATGAYVPHHVIENATTHEIDDDDDEDKDKYDYLNSDNDDEA